MLVLLVSVSVVILTTLADANRTGMTYTYCCAYSVEIILMMASGPVQNMYSTLLNKSEKYCLLLGFIM